jgi:hypothetical protein
MKKIARYLKKIFERPDLMNLDEPVWRQQKINDARMKYGLEPIVFRVKNPPTAQQEAELKAIYGEDY